MTSLPAAPAASDSRLSARASDSSLINPQSVRDGALISNREAALALARDKFRVFPLLPGKKVPALKWKEFATTHREQVEKLFPEVDAEGLLSAESNVAIATGNGLFVVDLDPRHGSDASIADLQEEHGALPETRTVKTPSGGLHKYYKAPVGHRVPNSTSKLGPGIDIRGDDGYVVAPPSVTDVGAYELVSDAPISDAPPWLLAAVTQPRAAKEALEQAPETLSTISEADYVTLLSAIYHEKLRERCADNGSWTEVGYSLLSLGAQGRQLFCEWSAKTPGFEVGAPENWWATHSQQKPRADWRHILTLARACGWRRPGAVAETEAFSIVETEPGTPPPTLPSKGALDAPGLPEILIRKLPEDWDTCNLAEERFVIENLIPRCKVTLLVSPGGMGKSYVTLYASICVALGLEFCGQKCEQGRVVILSAEDSLLTIHRRLRNLSSQVPDLQFAPNARAQIRQFVDIVDVAEMRRASGSSMALTKPDSGGSASITPLVKHLAEAIGNADFVWFDTASKFNGGEENSNGDTARFIEALEIVAEITGAGVLVLVHTGKARGEDQYAARGASAFSDNARSVLVLAPLDSKLVDQLANPAQSEKASRNDILKLRHTKSNYAARAEDMYFERHASGVLLPTQLTFALPTHIDLIAIMLEKIGTGEVTRKKIRDEYRAFSTDGVTRAIAVQAFDDAVNDGRLEKCGVSGRATRYRVKRTAAPANGDLV